MAPKREGPPGLQLLADLAVIILLIALVPLMAWVILAEPPIPQQVPSYFIAGVTVSATLFTSIVKSRIQHGLMRDLEHQLRNIRSSPEPITPSEGLAYRMPCWARTRPSQQELLDIKWRATLGIDSITEKVLYTKRIFLIYLPCALLTTSIVAAFTPNTGSQIIEYRPLVPGSSYSHSFIGETKACVGQDNKDAVPPGGTYRWQLPDGNYFFSRYQKECPANRILSHVFSVQSEKPDKYAYVDAGVAVDRTAMGASAHLFRGKAFQKLSQKYGRSLKNTTQCVPVMTSNPVTCAKNGGRLERDENDDRYLNFTLDEGGEMGVGMRSAGFSRNLSVSSVMLNFMWEDNRSHIVGQGVIAFSAYNDPDGITLFAKDLARTFGDPDKSAGTKGSETYVVTCNIDPSTSFEYRLVTLSLQAGGQIDSPEEGKDDDLTYSRRLSGGERCIPAENTVGNIHYATATSSQWHMVMQNYGSDGYFTNVHRLAGEDRPPPYAFNNSRNALEDILGIIAALGVSDIDLGDDPVVADAAGGEKAKAVIAIKQLGGNRLVLISLIPPLISIVILSYSFSLSFKESCLPGGEGAYGKRPELYAAESIRELITLGQPVTERVHLIEQRF
ncbi:hypothetical protein ACHAPT_011882 [Fusarium lateritium]